MLPLSSRPFHPKHWVAHAALTACVAISNVSLATLAQAPERAPVAAPGGLDATIVPPRLTLKPEVPYPSDGHGDASVILRLTINADGTVRVSEVTEGEEPFASAAQNAAKDWRFEPATRGGNPVASIVRFQVSFVEPVPAEVPIPSISEDTTNAESPPPNGVTPEASRPATSATAAGEEIEITVQGDRIAPAVTSFSAAEVRQLPGAFGDPFRAIEAMPGVTPIASGLPFFYVRGAPPGNVGYFLDGVRVPYLYHVGLGPSVIHPALVDRVDLYPGGYPARFGRYAGGIVSGEAKAPRTDFHGEGNIRLFDLGTMVESGFANSRGTILLGGRYSYTAAILSLIAPTVDLAYRDYQARITYDLTPRDRLTAFSFGSYDLLGQSTNGVESILFGSEFYRLDLRYEHDYSKGTTLRTAITLGYDQTRITDQRNAQDRMLATRFELRHRVSPSALVRGGADAIVDGFTADRASYADPDDPDTIRFNNLFPPRTDVALGLWTDLVVQVSPLLELTPGIRVDEFISNGSSVPALDPRIAAKYRVTKRLRIIHAYGLAHQPPSFVVPIPGLTPGDLQGGLQSSVQTSAGVEVDLPERVRATATLFHNAFYNMNDALGDRSNAVGTNVGDALTARARGEAYGFELFLHRHLSQKLGGFLTYTLSRATRTLNDQKFPSAFDRTHVFNAALAYDLGRSWRAGTRVVFYTGTPIVTPTRGLIVAQPTLSTERNPPFFRLDLRLEKRWKLSEKAWIAFIAEVMNATLSKETYNSTSIGPVTIPSIGAEAGF